MIVVLEVVVVPENVLVLAVLGGIRNISISAPGRTLQTQPLLPCQSSEHFRSFGLPGAVLRSCAAGISIEGFGKLLASLPFQ